MYLKGFYSKWCVFEGEYSVILVYWVFLWETRVKRRKVIEVMTVTWSVRTIPSQTANSGEQRGAEFQFLSTENPELSTVVSFKRGIRQKIHVAAFRVSHAARNSLFLVSAFPAVYLSLLSPPPPHPPSPPHNHPFSGPRKVFKNTCVEYTVAFPKE